MSKAFTSRVEGLAGVLKRIEAYDKKLSDDIDEVLDEGVQNMASKAKSLAPHGKNGLLQSSIGFSSVSKFNKQFFALAPYAAYVEFGTGSRVFESSYQFTDEAKEFAKEFYINGMGRMPASPFMFPAFESEKIEIIKKIRDILVG